MTDTQRALERLNRIVPEGEQIAQVLDHWRHKYVAYACGISAEAWTRAGALAALASKLEQRS